MSATYLINRTPTKVPNYMSPFEVLNKTKPSLDHLRVFGCLYFLLILGEQRRKLDAKSSKAMFIGYSPIIRDISVMIQSQEGFVSQGM